MCGNCYPSELQPDSIITSHELKIMMDRNHPFFLMDVREPEEYASSRIKDAVLIPLKTLPDKLSGLNKTQMHIVYCRSGGRSAAAVQFLKENGFENVKNLFGGIIEWEKETQS